MQPARPKRWPIVGLIVGMTLVLVPAATTMVNLSRASDIKGGLRQATITKEKEQDVGRTLGSASVTALLVPPGILLTVLSALALAGKERRRPRPRARV